jgi:hypothetical protein
MVAKSNVEFSIRVTSTPDIPWLAGRREVCYTSGWLVEERSAIPKIDWYIEERFGIPMVGW